MSKLSVRDNLSLDGVPIVRLESDWVRLDVAPSVGGRVVSLVEKVGSHEFLWRNRSLQLNRCATGSEYDPHFYGGIDELIPNDIPEVIDGVTCPDHGELWTTPLEYACTSTGVRLTGNLARFGLRYERTMSLRPSEPCVDFTYRITNITHHRRRFLWKLHAALEVQAGDLIDCPARLGQVVDLAWSRFHTLEPFAWPEIEGKTSNVVPAADGTVDFFYLSSLTAGRIAWRRPSAGLEFAYEFDLGVFPFVWIFASYGGFNGHYTVILEPCTAMPLSVNEAAAKNQCSVLESASVLETRVTIRLGQ